MSSKSRDPIRLGPETTPVKTRITDEFSPEEAALAAEITADDGDVASDPMLDVSRSVRRLVREVYRTHLQVRGDPDRAARLESILERALAELEALGDAGATGSG